MEGVMRKVLAVAAFFLLAGSLHAGQLMPRIGIDFGGTIKYTLNSVSINGDTANGFNIGGEYLSVIDNRTTIGAGIEYMLNRKISSIAGVTTTGDPTFYFVPIYGTLRFKLSETELSPFFKLNLGYNLIYDGSNDYKSTASLSGGLYYALGGGIFVSKTINFELIYSNYAGKVNTNGISLDTAYTKIGIVAGYLFDIK